MTYFETLKKKDCNGCGLCSLKCPKKAITMIEDNEGFVYPVIDKSKCINCNICKNICPNHEYNLNNKIKAYAAINKNKEDLSNSSSGGMFVLLAKYVLKNNGVVFGVKYDKNLIAVHSYTLNEDELIDFQGSKYVRSVLKNSFVEVKEMLKDKMVLFTGTPCQCQALRSFLGKDYTNLLTCDIICHSNPSPKVFKLYKEYLERKYSKRIKNIYFRTKKIGWHCDKSIIQFVDDTEIIESSYYHAFLVELLNRPSCHNCHFCSSNRLSDFTIGDAWGIEKLLKETTNNNTGISLLCVNTDKANKTLQSIKKHVDLTEIDLNEIYKYNHNHNVKINRNRNRFFNKLSNEKINNSNIVFYLNKYSKDPLWKAIIKKFLKTLKLR